MNKKKTILNILASISLGVFISCSETELKAPSILDDNAPFLETVGVVFAGSQDDDIDIPVVSPGEHTDNFEATELLDDAFHNVENGRVDTLFFSQLVSGKLVPFQSIDPSVFPSNMPERMKKKFKDGYPNLYKYYYDKRYESTWEDNPGGYNFFPKDTVVKMNWDDIKFWGLNNTGYALYSLYYPYNNRLPLDDSGNLDLYVEPDQRSIDALRKSNFLGGFHSSSKSGQRVKFKLYHLTSYIKVTLYIPVFNPHDTIINEQGNKEEVRTGFPADALQTAEVRNVYNRFRINWYGGRSSDTAPITAVQTDTERTDVLMYMPSAEDYADTDGLPPVVRVRLADYIRDAESNKEIPEYDDCWKITLSALIPGGQDYPIGDSQYPGGQTWTDLNFLRFNFRQNIGEVPKSYVFNGNSGFGLIGSGDALSIGQGKIQHLNLYIPRYGAAAVLLGANVVDWEQWYNDNMGLRKDDPLNPSNPDDDDPDDIVGSDNPDNPDQNS